MLGDWLNKISRKKIEEHVSSRLELISNVTISPDTHLREVKFTLLDFETTGLNIRKDRPIALGAVTIEMAKIQLGKQFDRILCQPDTVAGEATLIHEIPPEQIEEGEDLTQSLLDFYVFAESSILIAFHAPFDKAILTKASQKHLGYTPPHPFIDLEDIVNAYFPEKAKTLRGLDKWCEAFDLDLSIERHNASADALISAELMLVALHQAIIMEDTTLEKFLLRIKESARLIKQRQFM